MVNENIQGVIPLTGPGIKFRQNRNYGPGEYERLINAEITEEGTLKSRRAVVAVDPFDSGYMEQMERPGKFIGNIGKYAIFKSLDRLWFYSVNGVFELLDDSLDPYDLSGFDPSLPMHSWVGAFTYNGKAYLMSMAHVTAGVSRFRFYLHETDLANLTYFSSYTSTNVLEIASPTAGIPPQSWLYYKSHFIHKERLWIMTSKGAYFSKATDPKVFTVPDGGFFRFPEDELNYGVALNDNIYVMCDNSIHTIGYSTDPNVDASVVKISDGLGSDWATIHEDSVYFVKGNNLYSINGSNVDIALDLGYGLSSTNEWGDDTLFVTSRVLTRVFTYKNYLIIKHDRELPSRGVDAIDYRFYETHYMTTVQDLGPNCFFLNMNNGSSHVFKFRDQYLMSGGEGAKGRVTGNMGDFYLVGREDESNDNIMYMSSCYDTGISTGGYSDGDSDVTITRGYMYYIKPDYDMGNTAEPLDRVWQIAPFDKVWVSPEAQIKIANYSPDGNKYYFKKFRNLLLEGEIPQVNMGLAVLPWQSGVLTPWFNEQAISDMAGFRFAINQRLKALDVNIIKGTAVIDGNPTPNLYDFEIRDMRVLWTYTSRAPVGNV